MLLISSNNNLKMEKVITISQDENFEISFMSKGFTDIEILGILRYAEKSSWLKMINKETSEKKFSDKADKVIEVTRPEVKQKKEPTAATIKKDNKDRVKAIVILAKELFRTKEYAKAKAKYEEALFLDPDNKFIADDIKNCQKWIDAIKNLPETPKEEPVKNKQVDLEEMINEVQAEEFKPEDGFEIPPLL
jgi:tetratricopeptide (TPR) repeat protein